MMAKRIKDQGFKFLLDFHYSDTWADPSNQEKPAAWDTLNFKELTDSVYIYSVNVIHAFDSISALPDMVQIGNEVFNGFLWNQGRLGSTFNTPKHWKQFTGLLTTASNAINDGSGHLFN